MNHFPKGHNILFISFDTLRYDVAEEAFKKGKTPHLQALFKNKPWEKRHSPASFTYAAHHAFFAGFLPTPAKPGKHPRLFACDFAGSETTNADTVTFSQQNIVEGFSDLGYKTICIGGVGFFNKKNALGSVLPNIFDESHWSTELGVTDPKSTENQFKLAKERLQNIEAKFFLFINLSALHQPNNFYLDPNEEDSKESQIAALEYIDSQIPLLLTAIHQPCFCIFTSDHGTTYGEDGYTGHRLSHENVWTIPYQQFIL